MLGDVIFAVASAPGVADRGLLRVSGPGAFELAGQAFEVDLSARVRGVLSQVTVPVRAGAMGGPTLGSTRVDLITMPGPRSFTGEDTVEIHALGSPLLLARLGDALRTAGGRDATPGEFTRRAFENGRLGLAEAEAVGQLIHAESEEERRRAVGVLEGGMARATSRCRGLLQDGLAMLEAGLDFEDEDSIGQIATADWLPKLEDADAELDRLRRHAPKGGLGGGGDIVLVGAANAGKSSLCNALRDAGRSPGGGAARPGALVSGVAGTTRDVLAFEVSVPGEDGGQVRLLDAPGDLDSASGPRTEVDQDALRVRDAVVMPRVSGALWVVDVRLASGAGSAMLSAPNLVSGPDAIPLIGKVWTHADLVETTVPPAQPQSRDDVGAGVPEFLVSSETGAGIDDLRSFLIGRAGVTSSVGGVAADRVPAIVAKAQAALQQALLDARADQPPEVVALSVHEALEALDQVEGRSAPDDLLDRIFGQFCLGK